MKVYLRHMDEENGAFIGEVAPTELMDAFRMVRDISVYSGGTDCTDFMHQIVLEEEEAFFEIICS